MTTPTFTVPPWPAFAMAFTSAWAQATGFTPPAFAMTFTPRFTMPGSTLSIAPMKSRAYPICGSRSFCFCRMDIVTSAR